MKSKILKLLSPLSPKVPILALWACFIFSPPAMAKNVSSTSGGNNRHLGLGIMFGEPTGVTMKYWLSSVNAFDLGLTYSFGEFVEILGDYLWHFPNAFSGVQNKGAQEFIPYLGIGAVLFFDSANEGPDFGFRRNNRYYRGDSRSDIGIGLRIPLGIEFLPRNVPLGVFVEIAPGVGLAPTVFGFLQGVIGARYYF